VCLALITALAKYRTTAKELDADLRLLTLSKDKKEYLKEVVSGERRKSRASCTS
jgi:hypothetical protein